MFLLRSRGEASGENPPAWTKAFRPNPVLLGLFHPVPRSPAACLCFETAGTDVGTDVGWSHQGMPGLHVLHLADPQRPSIRKSWLFGTPHPWHTTPLVTLTRHIGRGMGL